MYVILQTEVLMQHCDIRHLYDQPMMFHSYSFSFLSSLLSGLVPAPAAESGHGGISIMKGAKKDVMAEKETRREKGCQGIRDVVALTPNPVQNHAPGPHLDRKTVGVGDQSPDHGPDQEREVKTKHGCSSHLSLPGIRGSQSQKTRGDTGQGPAQERGEEKKSPRIHRNLQAPALTSRKTQNSRRPRKKRKK